MKCENCGSEITEVKCPECGAIQTDLLEEASEMFESLPEEVQEFLKKSVEESATDEEFISKVMVGNCPNCGSDLTVDCENVRGIEDPTVGLCEECQHVWCLECMTPLDRDGPDCPHWEICDDCQEDFKRCHARGYLPECPKIKSGQ